MKKVLILTTHFPPSAHVGAKRIAKFCKYLPQFGWDPIVITRKISQYHLLDETLSENLPSNIEIYQVGREGKKVGKNRYSAKGAGQKNLLKIVLIKVYDFFVFYDYYFLTQAFLQSRKIIRKNNIKVVFATFPNAEPLLIGALLKIFLRIKLVCEFRDPWVLSHHNYRINILQKAVEKRIERYIFSNSEKIVTVGEEMKKVLLQCSRSRIDNNIVVIYNGFDKEDFVDLNGNTQNKQLVFTYAGTFGNKRSPLPLLEALSEIKKQDKWLADEICVNFIGEFKYDEALKEKAELFIVQEDLADMVKFVPFLPHKKALIKLAEGDVLLLIERPKQKETNNCWVVTSKLFEYLYIRKPILAMLPLENEAAKIILSLGAGYVVSPDDSKEITKTILKIYQDFVDNTLNVGFGFNEIEKYDRKRQTGLLADLFINLFEG